MPATTKIESPPPNIHRSQRNRSFQPIRRISSGTSRTDGLKLCGRVIATVMRDTFLERSCKGTAPLISPFPSRRLRCRGEAGRRSALKVTAEIRLSSLGRVDGEVTCKENGASLGAQPYFRGDLQ